MNSPVKNAILDSIQNDRDFDDLKPFLQRIRRRLSTEGDDYFDTLEQVKTGFQQVFNKDDYGNAHMEDPTTLISRFVDLVQYQQRLERERERLEREIDELLQDDSGRIDSDVQTIVRRLQKKCSLQIRRALLDLKFEDLVRNGKFGEEPDNDFIFNSYTTTGQENEETSAIVSEIQRIVDRRNDGKDEDERPKKKRKLSGEEDDDVEMEDRNVSIEEIIRLLEKNKTNVDISEPKGFTNGFKFKYVQNEGCFRSILETLKKNLKKMYRHDSPSSEKAGIVGIFGGCGIGKSRMLRECTPTMLQGETEENGEVDAFLKTCKGFNVSCEIEQRFFETHDLNKILPKEDFGKDDIEKLENFFECFHSSVILRRMYSFFKKVHLHSAVIGELMKTNVNSTNVVQFIEKVITPSLSKQRILIFYKNDETQFLCPRGEFPVFHSAKRTDVLSRSEAVFSTYLHSLDRIRLKLAQKTILFQAFVAGNLLIREVVDLEGSGFDVYSVYVGIEEPVERLIKSDVGMSQSMDRRFSGNQKSIFKRIDVGSGRVPLFVEKFGNSVVDNVPMQSLFEETYEKVESRISKAQMPNDDMRRILYLMLRRKKLKEVDDEKLAKDISRGFVYLDKEGRICQPPLVLKYYSSKIEEFKFYGNFVDGYFNGDQDYVRFEKQIGQFFTFKYNLLRNLRGKEGKIKYGELFEGSFMEAALVDVELPLTQAMEFVRCQSREFGYLKSVQTTRNKSITENYVGNTVCVWVGGQDENQDVLLFIFDENEKKYDIIQLEIKKHKKSSVFGESSKDSFPSEFSKALERDFDVPYVRCVFGYINTTVLQRNFDSKLEENLDEDTFLVCGNNFVEVFGNILLCDFFE